MTNPSVLTKENANQFAGLNVKKSNAYSRVDSGAFITLYGQGGSGKTTLAASAADAGNTLLLDAEGGVEAISHRKDVDVIDIFNWREFDRVTQELKKATHPYKNIIVDNLCEIITLDLQQITSSTSRAPEIQQWGQMSRDVLVKVREYRDMCRMQGINVFFIAWDADERDDRGVIKKDLAFTPALRKEYPGIVTTIGHIEVLNDPTMRKLSFAPGPRTVAKFRRSADSNANKIPFDIYYKLANLPMSDILNTMKGGDWPTNKYPNPRT